MKKSTLMNTRKNIIRRWQRTADQCRYYNDRIVNNKEASLDTLFDEATPEVQEDEKESWLEELRRAIDE